MSNLIKSGKVIDLGIPVNVGISYAFDSSKSAILENAMKVNKQSNQINGNNASPKPQIPQGRPLTKEEMINQYVEEAKMKAEEEYQSIAQQAYEEGIQKAEEDAKNIIANAYNERERILDDVVKLKENTLTERNQIMQSSEKELLDLSLDIVEKIINYEVDKSDSYVLGIVKDALDRVMSKKDVVVKLSTADYYTVLSNKKYLVANVKGFGEIELVQDEAMEPGSLIIDTPLGVIDGGLQTRMDNIQNAVLKMFNEKK